MLFFKSKKRVYEKITLLFTIDETEPYVAQYKFLDDDTPKATRNKKFYKFKSYITDRAFDSKNNDMGLYIRIKYNGVEPINYFDILKSDEYCKILENTSDPTEEEEFYAIHFIELFKLMKKYIISNDIKENQLVKKNIIYFANHDKTVEGYFIFHDSDFIDKKYYAWFKETLFNTIAMK